jgi:hypothetical protein
MYAATGAATVGRVMPSSVKRFSIVLVTALLYAIGTGLPVSGGN